MFWELFDCSKLSSFTWITWEEWFSFMNIFFNSLFLWRTNFRFFFFSFVILTEYFFDGIESISMLSPIREWFFLNFRQVILSFFSCELLSDIIFIAIFISEFRISEHDISITYLPFLHWTSIEIRRSSLNATFFISIRLWVSFLTTLFFIFVRHSIDLFIDILGWLPIFFMATDRLPTSFNMRSH